MSGRNALSDGLFAPDPNNPLAGNYTPADAADFWRQNLADTWQAMQNPQTWRDAANAYAQGMLFGTTAPGEGNILAYHGSPHSFDRFSSANIGTGEGAQAYGHGLYFAGNEGVARSYRDALSEAKTPEEVAAQYLSAFGGDRAAAIAQMQDHARGGMDWPADTMRNLRAGLQMLKENPDIESRPPGHMYQVSIAAQPEQMLDWDNPVSTHPAADAISTALQRAHFDEYGVDDATAATRAADTRDAVARGMTGSEAYKHLQRVYGAEGAAQQLRQAGVPGISYLDAGSRAAGGGSRNHVVFDDSLISVLKKYGIAGLFMGGGAAAGGAQDQQ